MSGDDEPYQELLPPTAAHPTPRSSPPRSPPRRSSPPRRGERRPLGLVTGLRTSPTGAGCPQCLSPEYGDHYTLWHILASVVFFPFGVLSLLAPVRICRNGHRYGAGLGVVRGLKIFFVFAVVAALVAGWLLWRTFHFVVTQLGG